MPSTDPNFDQDLLEDGPAVLHAMEGLLSHSDDFAEKGNENNEPFHAPRSFTQQYYGRPEYAQN
jgi:hypothetical protein